MTQESLPFGRLHRVGDGARTLYRHLNDAVDAVGILPATGACGIDRSDLRRALDRDGRRVAVEHAMSIAALVSSSSFELGAKIASAFVSPLDLMVNAPVPMTDRERADRLEMAIRSMPLGEQLVAHALGGRR